MLVKQSIKLGSNKLLAKMWYYIHYDKNSFDYAVCVS